MREEVREFLGIDQSAPALDLQPGVGTVGYNTAFRDEPAGKLGVEPRPGLRLLETLPDAVICALYQWSYADADGVISRHLIAVTEANEIYDVKTPASDKVDTTAVTFTGASSGVRFAEANNILCLITATGCQIKIYRLPGNSTLYAAPMGIVAPGTLTFVSEDPGGDLAGGTIDVACTFYNDNTGTESSRSALLTHTCSGTSVSITVSTALLDPHDEVTHLNVYLRRQEIQTKLWRDATLRFDWPLPAHQFVLSFDDDALNAMTTPAPDMDQNDPPLATFRGNYAWHQNRMFATDGLRVYYTQLGNPEQWDPEFVEEVSTIDGQQIQHLLSLGPQSLLVLKDRSIWAISGDAPQTWMVSRQVPTQGAIAPDSIVTLEHQVYGWSESGPFRWAPGEPMPTDLAPAVVLPRHRAGTLTLRSTGCLAVADPLARRVLFFPTVTDRWTALPYSALGFWEAAGWDLGAVTAVTSGVLATGVFGVIVAVGERIGELDTATTSDWVTGTATTAVSSAEDALVTTAAISTSGEVLALVHSTSLSVTYHTYTTANGTTVTISPAVTVPAGSYVIVDKPVVQWESGAFKGNGDYVRKRYLFAEARTESGLSGAFGVRTNESSMRRTWALATWQRLRRIAASGWWAQIKAVAWGTGRLWSLSLRSEARHDRR